MGTVDITMKKCLYISMFKLDFIPTPRNRTLPQACPERQLPAFGRNQSIKRNSISSSFSTSSLSGFHPCSAPKHDQFRNSQDKCAWFNFRMALIGIYFHQTVRLGGSHPIFGVPPLNYHLWVSPLQSSWN